MATIIKKFYTVIDGLKQISDIERLFLVHNFFWNGKGYGEELTRKEIDDLYIQNQPAFKNSNCRSRQWTITKSNDTYNVLQISNFDDNTREMCRRAGLFEIEYNDLRLALDISSKGDSQMLWICISKYCNKLIEKNKGVKALRKEIYDNDRKKQLDLSGVPSFERSILLSGVSLGGALKEFGKHPHEFDNTKQKKEPSTSKCPITPEIIKSMNTTKSNRWPERMLVDTLESLKEGKLDSDNFFNRLGFNKLVGHTTLLKIEINLKTKKQEHGKLFIQNF